MAVKNFVFRQNWVGRKVAGMKKNPFFPIFDPTWTHILAPKSPIKELLKQYFSEERHILIAMNVKHNLTMQLSLCTSCHTCKLFIVLLHLP